METKFTKGEWKNTNGGNISNDNVSGIIATAWSVYRSDEVEIKQENESWLDMRKRTEPLRIDAQIETEANVKLIAAAPDLFDAIESVLMAYKKLDGMLDEPMQTIINECKKAIKKATE